LRHVRSILYALVLAPAVWVLCGVGFTPELAGRGRDTGGTVESLTGLLLLLLAGAAYAILVFAPISPAGPTLAGLTFLGMGLWAFADPASYAAQWPPELSKETFNLSLPGYGLALVLAVPMICTVLSARRWARYEPPVLPVIGTLGRARGAAAAPGIPISASETAVLTPRAPEQPTQVIGLAGAEQPTEAVPLPAVALPVAASQGDGGEATTLLPTGPALLRPAGGSDDGEPTTVISRRTEPAATAGEDEPTTTLVSRAGAPGTDSEPPTQPTDVLAPPAQPVTDSEPTTMLALPTQPGAEPATVLTPPAQPAAEPTAALTLPTQPGTDSEPTTMLALPAQPGAEPTTVPTPPTQPGTDSEPTTMLALPTQPSAEPTTALTPPAQPAAEIVPLTADQAEPTTMFALTAPPDADQTTLISGPAEGDAEEAEQDAPTPAPPVDAEPEAEEGPTETVVATEDEAATETIATPPEEPTDSIAEATTVDTAEPEAAATDVVEAEASPVDAAPAAAETEEVAAEATDEPATVVTATLPEADDERTQLLRLPGGRRPADERPTGEVRPTAGQTTGALDLGRPTRDFGPGEKTQVIARNPGETTQVIRRSGGIYPPPGETTHSIDTAERTQIIRPPAAVTPDGPAPTTDGPAPAPAQPAARPPSIVDAERPDPSADPTASLVPADEATVEQRQGGTTTRNPGESGTEERAMTVLKMERPPDEAEEDTRPLAVPVQRQHQED